MSNTASDCMALFRDAKIRAKYEFYLRGGGCITGSSTKAKRGKEWILSESDKKQFIEKYQSGVKVSEIAFAANRSNDAVRRVLKEAGVYDVKRDLIATLAGEKDKIKTTYIKQ